MVNGLREDFDAEDAGEPLADLVAVLDQPDAETESDGRAKKADHDALADEDADDLSGAGAQGLEDADLPRFLHGDGDEGVHDPEGGNDHDEEQDEEHDVALHVDSFEEFAIHIHPGRDAQSRIDASLHAGPDGGGFVGVDSFDGEPVNSVAEPVEFLADVQRHEEEFRIVEVTSGGKDAGHGEFQWKDHFAQLAGRFGFVPALFHGVDPVNDLIQVPRRIDGDGVAHAHAENAGESGSQNGFIALEFQLPGDHEVLQSGDLTFDLGVDGANLRGEAAPHEFGQHGALDKRGHAGDTFNRADLRGLGRPVKNDRFTAGHEVRIEAEDFAPQFLFEAGHDRNNEDEHHDADGDTKNRNNRDQAEEGALRAKVTQGEEKAEGFGHT